MTGDGVTRRNTLAPFIVVVGASPHFVGRCRASVSQDILVGGVSPANFPNQAARLRPYVVIVTNGVRAAFDQERFDEIARAVGARVVCVSDETVADAELSRSIPEAFEAIARMREAKPPSR